MLKTIYNKKNDILATQRNLAIIVASILLIITLCLSICLMFKDTNTILVPFEIKDQLSLSGKKPQNSYLEAISRDIINTMLNLTPNNVEYVEKTILSYADGSSYGKLKNQLEKLRENVVSKKFSTIFYINSIYPNNINMSVVVDGILSTYFGQKEVSRDKKSYEIKYSYKTGRLYIVGFSEIVQENDNK